MTEPEHIIDSLGQYDPALSIGHFGGDYGWGGFYRICSTAVNAPAGRADVHEPLTAVPTREQASPAVRAAHAAAHQKAIDALAEIAGAHGYVEIDRGLSGFGTPYIRFEHAATRQAMDAAAEAWKGAAEIYMRYGDLPADGHSRNYRDSHLEAGVSCFRGQLRADGRYRVVAAHPAEIGSLLMGLRSRPCYQIDGDRIGTGSDGEPLLRNARIVRRLDA